MSANGAIRLGEAPAGGTERWIARWSFLALKGTVDFFLSLCLLILLLPVFVLVGVLVKCPSRGPMLYVHDRVGLGGRVFRMLKFRTMVCDAEALTGPVWARPDDPRVTAMGRFLRKYHFDELPQFVNVLKGDMSLVGPRPERPVFVRVFAESIPHYSKRLGVKPGITGLAQILRRYDESVADVRKKLALDLLYIRRMCWMVDLLILSRTVSRVLRGRPR
ncbi:MAG: sugar transferase [Planctomycetes bacterium]|nr:sugar transferase [Planctomycetota bacterium]